MRAVASSYPTLAGWQSDFRPAPEQLERQAARLRALVGRRITEIWTVGIAGERWIADLPVIVCFDDGTQLEICWEHLDALSLTWHTIALGTPPGWWEEWELEWRREAEPVLADVVGGVVADVRATTFRLEVQGAEGGTTSRAAWMTAGLWLGTDTGGLHVVNALDENGLSGELPVRDATRDWREV